MQSNNNNNQPPVIGPRLSGRPPAGDQDDVLNVDDNGLPNPAPRAANAPPQQNNGARDQPVERQISLNSVHNVAPPNQERGGNAQNARLRENNNGRAQFQLRLQQFMEAQVRNAQGVGGNMQQRLRQFELRNYADHLGFHVGVLDDDRLGIQLNFERQQIPRNLLQFNQENDYRRQNEANLLALSRYAGEEPQRNAPNSDANDANPIGPHRDQRLIQEIVQSAEQRALQRSKEREKRKQDGDFILSSNRSEQIDLEARSCGTVQSAIPDEKHFRFNNERLALDQVPRWRKPALQNQRLLMIFIHWQKQSHGLFDYELRHVTKMQHSVCHSVQVVRKGTQIRLAEVGASVPPENVDRNEQQLFTVTKCDNGYEISGVEADPLIDIDDCYTENGTSTLEPCQMQERMYHAVRFLKRGVNQSARIFEHTNHLLKKNDIIKLGRIKLKVKKVHIKTEAQAREKTLMRRRERLSIEYQQSRARIQRMRLKYPKMRSNSQEQQFQSKYKKDYDQLSPGSYTSIHSPIVGERNYVRALTPIKRRRKKPSKPKKKRKEGAEDQKKVEQKKTQQTQQHIARHFTINPHNDSQQNSVHQLPYIESMVRELGQSFSLERGRSLSPRAAEQRSQHQREVTQEPVGRAAAPRDPAEESKHAGSSVDMDESIHRATAVPPPAGDLARASNSEIAGREPMNLLDQIEKDLHLIEPANARKQPAPAAAREGNIVLEGNGATRQQQQVIDIQKNGVFDNPFDVSPSRLNQPEQQQPPEASVLINIGNEASNLISNQRADSNVQASSNDAMNSSSNQPLQASEERLSFMDRVLMSSSRVQASRSAPIIGTAASGLVAPSESASSVSQAGLLQQQIQNQQNQQDSSNQRNGQASMLRTHGNTLLNSLNGGVQAAGAEEIKENGNDDEQERSNLLPMSHMINNQNAPSPNWPEVDNNQNRERRELRQQKYMSAPNVDQKSSQSSVDAKNSKEEFQSQDSSQAEADSRAHEYSNADQISIYSETAITCRVCWGENNTQDNPLLRVCQCRGGVEFIHFQCLRNWIKTKEEKSMYQTYTIIQWRQFECEICKSQLPYVFINNGMKYNLIDIPSHASDHLILESISLIENKNNRVFFILHPNRSRANLLQRPVNRRIKYRIGRGHDCQLHLTDISASRNHAEIIFDKGEFRLADHMSKFGTLVLARKPIHVSEGVEQAVQIGRSLVLFKTVDEPFKMNKNAGFMQTKNDAGLASVKSFHAERKSFRKNEILMERSGIKKPGDRRPNSGEQSDSIDKFYAMCNFDFMSYLNFIEDNYTLQDILVKQREELLQFNASSNLRQMEEDEELKHIQFYEEKAARKKREVEEDMARRPSHSMLKDSSEGQDIYFKEKIKAEEEEERKRSQSRNNSECMDQIEEKKQEESVNLNEGKKTLLTSRQSDNRTPSSNNIKPNEDQREHDLADKTQDNLKDSKEVMAEVKVRDELLELLNKGVKRPEHVIEPSEHFLMACQMFQEEPATEDAVLQGRTPALQQRSTAHRNDTNLEFDARQRFLISWNKRVDFQSLRRAKFLQKEHKGQPPGSIMGQKLPKKIKLSDDFFEEKMKVNVEPKKNSPEDKVSKISDVAEEQVFSRISEESREELKARNERKMKKAKLIQQLLDKRKKLMCWIISAEESLKSSQLKLQRAQELQQKEHKKRTFEDEIEEKDNKKLRELEEQIRMEQNQIQEKQKYQRQVVDDGKQLERLHDAVKRIDEELANMKHFEEQHEVLKLRQKVIRNDIQRIWRLHIQNSEDNLKVQQEEDSKRRFH